ncbi:hypothetical protein L1887_18983 [Cichorium endivia]|nr:hypothetical protein L1887_18983 [Cichorium endivia]
MPRACDDASRGFNLLACREVLTITKISTHIWEISKIEAIEEAVGIEATKQGRRNGSGSRTTIGRRFAESADRIDEIREESEVKGGVDRVFDGPAFDRSTDLGSTTDLRGSVKDDLLQMNTYQTEGVVVEVDS